MCFIFLMNQVLDFIIMTLNLYDSQYNDFVMLEIQFCW